jgi:hypothetical protein
VGARRTSCGFASAPPRDCASWAVKTWSLGSLMTRLPGRANAPDAAPRAAPNARGRPGPAPRWRGPSGLVLVVRTPTCSRAASRTPAARTENATINLSSSGARRTSDGAGVESITTSEGRVSNWRVRPRSSLGTAVTFRSHLIMRPRHVQRVAGDRWWLDITTDGGKDRTNRDT